MRAILQTLGGGAVAGMLLFGLITLFDALAVQSYPFGVRTGTLGAATGGISLVLALLMSYISYELAKRNKAGGLRRRLLSAAIFTGAAGFTCGLASMLLWLGAGRPWYH